MDLNTLQQLNTLNQDILNDSIALSEAGKAGKIPSNLRPVVEKGLAQATVMSSLIMEALITDDDEYTQVIQTQATAFAQNLKEIIQIFE
ncbi:hypothetical protein [Photobacterium galatheae]|uniref:Uncharacterized protein n=1 Tax=Photobacterium galatheae TaxID=1654360 RepID=A0A066RTJ7_9GAMM|nr:hypothetical protein [Photobacterium galatheae]KDM91032.1 hypothetical protein EA58_14890 [Photobacterium galatheae]MCM0149016.1 hypothetical protein [Photobacterium galatheae]